MVHRNASSVQSKIALNARSNFSCFSTLIFPTSSVLAVFTIAFNDDNGFSKRIVEH